MKERYFLRDPKGLYRGLFHITPEHADRLRKKGWSALRAANKFGKIHPWTKESDNG